MPKPKKTEESVRRSLTEAKKNLQKKLGKAPSISALCIEAEISRAYIYASYPQLIEEFSSRTRSSRKNQKATTITALKKELKNVRTWNTLLARSCIELKLALTQLQSRYQREIKKNRENSGSK